MLDYEGSKSPDFVVTHAFSIPGGNNVTWSLDDTTLEAQSDGQVIYSGQQKNKFEYNEYVCMTKVTGCTIRCTSCNNHPYFTDVTLKARAILSLDVGGSGREQTITIETSGQSVSTDGKLSGGGPSGSDDVEAQVNQQIRDQVPDQIASKLEFDFEAISIFALKNLLFPSNNYIDFSLSALPGDMLIVGNFTTGVYTK